MPETIRRIRLDPVAPDDEATLRAWYALECAVAAADRPHEPPPGWPEYRVRLTVPWPGERVAAWAARADDRGSPVVGVAELALPTLDNLQSSFADLLVAPEHRRAGVGRALLAHLAAHARAEGRVRMAAVVGGSRSDPGALFAAAAGAKPALAVTERRMPVPGDTVALARLGRDARAHSGGYQLVQWTGQTPHRWLDDIAELTARMSTDSPLDDLHLEPECYDADRIRRLDAARSARAITSVVTAAAHTASGRLVAFTHLAVRSGVAWHAEQGDTIVAPEHRGRRLGGWIKVANLERARRERPGLSAVDTWNADSNPWMVAINEAMGFRSLHRWTEWELDLVARPAQPATASAISAAASGP